MELAPAIGQLSTLSADLSSIKFMFSLIERRNSSGVGGGEGRGLLISTRREEQQEQQEKHKKQSMEQSTLQLTLHKWAWGRGSSSRQTSALLPCFISREMREMQDAFTPAIAWPG